MQIKKLSLVVMLLSLTMLLMPSAFANGCDGVIIKKWLDCGSAPTCGLGIYPEEPWVWFVGISVRNDNPYTITNVYVEDRFGAEFAVTVESGPNYGTVSLTTKGASNKVFLEWDIGSLGPGAWAGVLLRVQTDLNPAGRPEFTSCGEYYMNSGAVVKWLDDLGKQHSLETGTIMVTTY